MRTIQSLFFFVALTLAACVPDDKSGPNPTETTVTIPTQGATSPTSYPNMSLFWADEFTGETLDESKWNVEVNGFGGGNNELQFSYNALSIYFFISLAFSKLMILLL
mgnify:CR=1 FL=1